MVAHDGSFFTGLTMRFLIAVIFLILSATANAAAPTLVGEIVATPATGGTAPFCVHLDASAAADADLGTKAFIGLSVTWDFGDTSAYWTYGTGTSKNLATGPVAAHCYETAGTYTVTVRVSDGTTTISDTETITVTAADTTWATNTMCVANGSLPVAGSGGCPSGATARNGAGDFDADIAAAFGANGCGTGVPCKRVLFKRGDSFTQDTTINAGALTGIYIGAYGTGAKPAISKTATGDIQAFTFNSTASDWKFVDLAFTGGGVTDAGYFTRVETSQTASDVVILRVDVDSMSGLTNTNGDYLTTKNHGIWENIFVQESTNTNNAGGNGVFGSCYSGAYLGNSIGPLATGGTAEHGFRLQHSKKCVITGNTMTGALTDKAEINIRAREYATDADFSEKTIISENKFISVDSAIIASISRSNDGDDQRIQDSIVERNIFVSGANTQYGVSAQGYRIAIRNNIFHMTGGTAANAVGLNTDTASGMPTSDSNEIVGNTLVAMSNIAVRIALLGAGGNEVDNTTFKNNLAYTNTSGTAEMLNDSCPLGCSGTATVGSAGGNSTDAQMATNPFATTPSTSDFVTYAPSVAGYADDGGITAFPATGLFADFFRCHHKTAATYQIGAIVDRANAICTGRPEVSQFDPPAWFVDVEPANDPFWRVAVGQ